METLNFQNLGPFSVVQDNPGVFLGRISTLFGWTWEGSVWGIIFGIIEEYSIIHPYVLDPCYKMWMIKQHSKRQQAEQTRQTCASECERGPSETCH